MSASGRLVAGLDIGGTKVAGGIVESSGAVISRYTASTDRDDAAAIDNAVRKFVEWCCEWAAAEGEQLDAACVGVPEYVSADGEVTSSEVLHWIRQPRDLLVQGLKPLGLTGAGCAVVSDARAGAMGEAAFGAGRGEPSFLYLSIGTGLSSALVVGGRPWPGRNGRAIAFGEIRPLVPRASKIEQLCSGRGIEDQFAIATGRRMSCRAINNAATAGDRASREVLGVAADELANAIRSVVGVLDPGVLILGGGLGSSESYVMDEVQDRYAALTAQDSVVAPLVRAALRADSGLLGCAAAAMSLIENSASRSCGPRSTDVDGHGALLFDMADRSRVAIRRDRDPL